MLLAEPKNYIDRLILPMFKRFANEPNAIELAFALAVFIGQIADVLALHENRGVKEVRNDLCDLNPEFSILYAISTAAKHVRKDDPHLGNVGLSSDDAEIGGSAAFSDGTYFSDGTTWSDHSDVIKVRTPDNNWHDMVFACHTVVDSLKRKYC